MVYVTSPFNNLFAGLFWKDGVTEFEIDNSQNSSCVRKIIIFILF